MFKTLLSECRAHGCHWLGLYVLKDQFLLIFLLLSARCSWSTRRQSWLRLPSVPQSAPPALSRSMARTLSDSLLLEVCLGFRPRTPSDCFAEHRLAGEEEVSTGESRGVRSSNSVAPLLLEGPFEFPVSRDGGLFIIIFDDAHATRPAKSWLR